MARYVVTGGAGFIGSHITERLLGEGHHVRVLDDFSSGRESNLAGFGEGAPLDVMRGDVADPDIAQQAVAGVDGVFHMAALGSVPRSVADPQRTHVVNTTGSLNVLVACRDLGVRRVVYAGSSSVYGELEELPKREDHPTFPISPYGLSKLVGEEYCRIFNDLYGLEAVSLRFYNVFGPRQNPEGPYAAVIPIWVSRLLAGEPPLVNGDGEHTRDFTYVANVVDANLLAMNAPADRVRQGLFNVAAGGRVSLNRLLAALQEALGTNVAAEYGPPRAGDIRDSQADITRIREALGYEPRVSFEEGIRRTTEYFRKEAEAA